MNAFLALYIYLGINVTIGGYNHPSVGMPAGWPGGEQAYYRAMLDSAVSCGLGYFKPGWLFSYDTSLIDSTTKITSEFPLTQVFIRFPPGESTATHSWWNWWYRMAEKYNGDGEGDLEDAPTLKDNPVKYWEISLLPYGGYPRPWRKDNGPIKGDTIDWAITELGSADKVIYDGEQHVWVNCYNIDTEQEYNHRLTEYSGLRNIFWRRMNMFLEYFRVSAKAIDSAYTYPPGQEVYIIGPGDAFEYGPGRTWSVYVIDTLSPSPDGPTYVELLFYPKAVEKGETGSNTHNEWYFWKVMFDSIGQYIDIVSSHNGTPGVEEAAHNNNFAPLEQFIYKMKQMSNYKPYWETEVGIDPNRSDSSGIWFSNFYRGWLDRAFRGDTIDLNDGIIFRSFANMGPAMGSIDSITGVLNRDLSHKATGVYDTLRNIINDYFLTLEAGATAYNNQRKLAIDVNGNLHRVITSGHDVVRYAMSEDNGQSWKNTQILGIGKYPAIAIDADGGINVCWVKPIDGGFERLYFRRKPKTGDWGAEIAITFPFSYIVPPSICVGTDDTVHIGLKIGDIKPSQDSISISVSEWRFSVADYPDNLPDNNIKKHLVDEWKEALPETVSVSIDLSNSNFPHICWEKQGTIYYRHFDSNGWSAPELISPLWLNNQHPCIEMWEDYVHIVWEREGTIYHRCGKIIPIVANSERWETVNWSPVVDDVSYGGGKPGYNPVIVGGSQILWSGRSAGEIYHAQPGIPHWIVQRVTDWGGPPFRHHPQVALQLTTPRQGKLHYIYTEGTPIPYEYEIKYGTKDVTIPLLGSGSIAQNTTWDTDVFVTGDVIVDSGVTLTIEPGVTVYFMAQDDQRFSEGEDSTKPEVIVYGTLIADSADFIIAGKQYWKIDNMDVGYVELTDCLLSHETDLLSSPAPPAPQASSQPIPATSSADVSEAVELPKVFKFYANYPNPFTQSTIINYQLPVKSKVSLRIYDITGRLVKELIDGDKEHGDYKLNWDANGLSSGVYFIKFCASGVAGEKYRSNKKLIILREGGGIE